MDPQNFEKCVVLNENNIFAYLESLDYDSSKLVTKILNIITKIFFHIVQVFILIVSCE